MREHYGLSKVGRTEKVYNVTLAPSAKIISHGRKICGGNPLDYDVNKRCTGKVHKTM